MVEILISKRNRDVMSNPRPISIRTDCVFFEFRDVLYSELYFAEPPTLHHVLTTLAIFSQNEYESGECNKAC